MTRRHPAPHRRPSRRLAATRVAPLALEAPRYPNRCRLTITHHGRGRMPTKLCPPIGNLLGDQPLASTRQGSITPLSSSGCKVGVQPPLTNNPTGSDSYGRSTAAPASSQTLRVSALWSDGLGLRPPALRDVPVNCGVLATSCSSMIYEAIMTASLKLHIQRIRLVAQIDALAAASDAVASDIRHYKWHLSRTAYRMPPQLRLRLSRLTSARCRRL